MSWYIIICLWSHTCHPLPYHYGWGVAEVNKTRVYDSKETCEAIAKGITNTSGHQTSCVPLP